MTPLCKSVEDLAATVKFVHSYWTFFLLRKVSMWWVRNVHLGLVLHIMRFITLSLTVKKIWRALQCLKSQTNMEAGFILTMPGWGDSGLVSLWEKETTYYLSKPFQVFFSTAWASCCKSWSHLEEESSRATLWSTDLYSTTACRWVLLSQIQSGSSLPDQ